MCGRPTGASPPAGRGPRSIENAGKCDALPDEGYRSAEVVLKVFSKRDFDFFQSRLVFRKGRLQTPGSPREDLPAQ